MRPSLDYKRQCAGMQLRRLIVQLVAGMATQQLLANSVGATLAHIGKMRKKNVR